MSASPGKRFRLQGTDGIRREIRRSNDPSLKGLNPLEAFLQEGVITETFMERYAYAHVHHLVSTKQIKKSQGFVVGWDPRDVAGHFTNAVIRGVRKAGVDALVLGIVPTPLVPMFVMHLEAGGGFMVTASHNPKDQNGIKTFLAYRGMKLLPENDITLTQAIFKLKSIEKKPLRGKRIDCRKKALALFETFSLAPENSWIENPLDLENIILVVDPARGALTGIAADLCRQAGFGKVIEVNNTLDGAVNHYSGVADLEGHTQIPAEAIVKNGAFARHKAVVKLFELGRKNKARIKKGTVRVSGAVFDADGDRFYRLEYNPFTDALAVLSGDETAFLQAQFLMKQNPKLRHNQAYIHTVESDLNTGAAAEKLGYRRQLSAVGDKWILYRIALMIVEARFRSLKHHNTLALDKKLKALKQADRFDVSQFQKLENAISRFQNKVSVLPSAHGGTPHFAVGSEETGHNITSGYMKTLSGNETLVFCGNGLKSALNTFAATQSLLGSKSPKQYFSKLERPFASGFKSTLYVYYVRQENFHSGSPVWRGVQRLISKLAKTRGYRCRALPFREDPDMLYLGLQSKTESRAGIFVRNSGTENKISVNLRGTRKDASALKAIGSLAVQLLFLELKDTESHFYKLELHLLSQIAAKPLPGDRITDPEEQRVLMELGKQKLIEPGPKGFQLTPLGKWYILH